jgi:hypothetical protein
VKRTQSSDGENPPLHSATLALTHSLTHTTAHAPFLHATHNYPQSFNYTEQITAHAPPFAVGVHSFTDNDMAKTECRETVCQFCF